MAQDSPVLDALALNYLTYGFQTLANNLWAWITLITTTAITFWGTTNTTTAASPQDLPPPPLLPEDVHVYHQAAPIPSTNINIDTTHSLIGRTRGKFALYFDLVQEEDLEEEENLSADSSISCRKWPEEEWEAEKLRMRMDRNLSWYRFQDLTVIDGNVVKVWEDDYAGRRRGPRLPNVLNLTTCIDISTSSTFHF